MSKFKFMYYVVNVKLMVCACLSLDMPATDVERNNLENVNG